MKFLRYVGGLWLMAMSAGIGLPLAFLALCLCAPGVLLALLAAYVWPDSPTAQEHGLPTDATTTHSAKQARWN